jgi:Barnase-EndoU-ColicinE5/D-RelE like nuclease
MGRIADLRPDSPTAQTAGVVPRSIVLPANLVGRKRSIQISPESVSHIRRRRLQWLAFCLEHIPEVLAAPDYIGQRPRGDPHRVEFVRLVGRPGRWLLVSVKFLDEKREAWVNSAHPIADANLTRRLRAGTLWIVTRGP